MNNSIEIYSLNIKFFLLSFLSYGLNAISERCANPVASYLLLVVYIIFDSINNCYRKESMLFSFDAFYCVSDQHCWRKSHLLGSW